ncbi:hypothetical protein RJT34_16545 [Clitoria ternatea]|uniref:Uncharacterized protein n=1 Tax=Clitoria ternatea TaxID=43366 RepID=A0AAN9PCE6_CLITE
MGEGRERDSPLPCITSLSVRAFLDARPSNIALTWQKRGLGRSQDSLARKNPLEASIRHALRIDSDLTPSHRRNPVQRRNSGSDLATSLGSASYTRG